MKFIDLRFVNLGGKLCSKTIPYDEFNSVMSWKGVDGFSLGYTSIKNSDLKLVPDESTLISAPGKFADDHYLVVCDLEDYDDLCFYPRKILKHEVDKINKFGYDLLVGFELEFNLMHPKVDCSGFYCSQIAYPIVKFLEEAFLLLHNQDIVGYHHEVGSCQYELNLGFNTPVKAVDNLLIIAETLKCLASENGFTVNFAPRIINYPACICSTNGLHINQSIHNNCHSAKCDLSLLLKSYIEGLMRRAHEFAIISNSVPDSYLRLCDGDEVSSNINWDYSDRSVAIRISQSCGRFEYRMPDFECNPYLVVALMIASGYEGLVNSYQLREPSSLSLQIEYPRNIEDSIKLFESSIFCRACLGEYLHKMILMSKCVRNGYE